MMNMKFIVKRFCFYRKYAILEKKKVNFGKYEVLNAILKCLICNFGQKGNINANNATMKICNNENLL